MNETRIINPPHMTDIETMPTSVRERLDLAQRQAEVGNAQEAMNLMRDAGVMLARTQPEMMATLMAGMLGRSGIRAEDAISEVTTVTNKLQILGVTVAKDVQTTTVNKVRQRKMELF